VVERVPQSNAYEIPRAGTGNRTWSAPWQLSMLDNLELLLERRTF